jgi:hypothetical protein
MVVRRLTGKIMISGWRDWVSIKSIMVRNADTNFISFCNSRGLYKQEELF